MTSSSSSSAATTATSSAPAYRTREEILASLDSYHFVRDIEMFGQTIQIIQDTRTEDHAAQVWDSSLVFAHYFENTMHFPPAFFSKKKVIELGSGTGLIGIIVALMGGHVTITDRAAALPLIHLNAQLNLSKQVYESRVKIQEFLWGETPVDEEYDYVVAADCVYSNKEMWTLFAKALDQICEKSGGKTLIYLAYELRSKIDAEFFTYIKEQLNYSVSKVDEDDLHEHWRADEIGVFQIKKKTEQSQSSETKPEAATTSSQ